MAIRWPSDAERSNDPPRPPQPWLTSAGWPIQLRKGDLPSASKRRDVLVVLALIVLAVLIGVLLWTLGPVPRVFPLMS